MAESECKTQTSLGSAAASEGSHRMIDWSIFIAGVALGFCFGGLVALWWCGP